MQLLRRLLQFEPDLPVQETEPQMCVPPSNAQRQEQLLQTNPSQGQESAYKDVVTTGESLDFGRDITYYRHFNIGTDEITHHQENGQPSDALMEERLDESWAADYEDCCIYVLHTLEAAGYDVDKVITVNQQTTTVRRFVLIHAETLLHGNSDGYADIATNEKHPYHAVLKGVVTALTASKQGTELDTVDAIRPGDLLQWWTEGNSGHTTIIHQVKTNQGIINNNHKPEDYPQGPALQVEAVAVLGAQTSIRSYQDEQQEYVPAGAESQTPDQRQEKQDDLFTKEDDVYVTDFVTLDDNGKGFIPGLGSKNPRAQIVNWWSVRPNGSKWKES